MGQTEGREITSRKQFLRLTFDLPAEPAVQHDDQQRRLLHYKVGISWTKPEYAKLNLETEIPHWDLVKLQHAAAKTWHEHVVRLAIERSPDWLRVHVAKNLNKCLRHPNFFSDANGQFLGFDGKLQRRQAVTDRRDRNYPVLDGTQKGKPLERITA